MTPEAAGEGGGGGEQIRLQKVLAQAGLGSRRHCDELIAAGRVAVNGEPARPGRRVDPQRDRVTLDGALVPVARGFVYYLLNKPRGVVCTAHDPQSRTCITSLVPDEPRVFSVGRLDAESEGLIVLTNDGDMAQTLTHPSLGVAKEYLVEVEGTPGPGAVRQLRHGVELADGPTAPARVGVLGPGVLRITVHEGRNRLVRRMCETVGHPVRRLVRVRIGPVSDAGLAPGQWRPLRGEEIRSLLAAGTPGRGRGRATEGHGARS